MMAAGVALAAALVLSTGVAGADGTPTPVGAPTIRIGVTEFGNTEVPDASPYQDYYRLPALRAGDLVTVAARTPAGEGRRQICLAADIDGYNWRQEGCNLAPHVTFRSDGSRIQFRANRATNNAFLRVMSYDYGPYEVTVERIQHQVGLTMEAPASVKTNGTVSVAARQTDGRNMPDGFRIQLIVRAAGRDYSYVSAVRGGRATFNLALAGDAAGTTATFTARAPESGTFQATSSIPANLRIVK